MKIKLGNNLNKKSYVSSTSYQGQFNNYKFRLYNIRLIWCKQVKNILQKNFRFSKKLKINDFGCCYFPFYKELKLNNLDNDYYGFDNDKKTLSLGLKKFPELKKKCRRLNIESYKPIRKANISIVSSLLEHLYEPTKVLNYLIKNTKDCLILRIPISNESSSHFFKKTQKNSSWIFNIFKKKDIIEILKKKNFALNFHADKASQKSRIGSKLIKSLKRKIVIIEAKKK